MYRTSRGQSAKLSFFNLLRNTEYFDATDARDKVYALVGLATTDADPMAGKFFIQPDYRLSRYEVYERVSRKLLLSHNIIEVLVMVEHLEPVADGEASWVPDFSQRLSARPFPANVFQAHGGTQAKICPVKHNQNDLTVAGIDLDTVTKIASTFDPDTSVGDEVARAERLKSLIQTLKTLADIEAIALLLTAGMDSDLEAVVANPSTRVSELRQFLSCDLRAHPIVPPPEPPSDSDSEYSDDWKDQVAVFPPYVAPDVTNDVPTISRRLLRAAYTCLEGRSVFITKEGRLGLASYVVQEGDVVALLFGCSVPIVLRPQGAKYQVFGACYLHDVMQGQAVQEWEERCRPSKDFVIV